MSRWGGGQERFRVGRKSDCTNPGGLGGAARRPVTRLPRHARAVVGHVANHSLTLAVSPGSLALESRPVPGL